MESAACRKINRTRHVSTQDRTDQFLFGARDWHGGEERFGVRMERRGEQRSLLRELNYFSEIHDGDLVRDMLDHR